MFQRTTYVRLIVLLGIAVVSVALTVFAGAAWAVPIVTFKAKAVPIRGFADTGNILGAGATLKSEFTIQGSEYGGLPSPLTGVKILLPTGTTLRTAGFPTCPLRLIGAGDSKRCPKKSATGPSGETETVDLLGPQRIREKLSIKGFYVRGGSLDFAIHGTSPAAIELVSGGRYRNWDPGPEATFTMPLVSTVPGANYGSTERIVTTLGSAVMRHGKPIYSTRMPRACPSRHLTFRAMLTFAEGGNTATPVTVPVSYKAACPRTPHHRRRLG